MYVCMYVCVWYDKVRNGSNKLGYEVVVLTTAQSIKWYCNTIVPLIIDVTTKYQGLFSLYVVHTEPWPCQTSNYSRGKIDVDFERILLMQS